MPVRDTPSVTMRSSLFSTRWLQPGKEPGGWSASGTLSLLLRRANRILNLAPDNLGVARTGNSFLRPISKASHDRVLQLPAAAEKLAKWKAKWFDEKGEFRNKVWPNITSAAAELSNVTFNHSDTPSAKEAEKLKAMLDASKADAREKNVFPTLPK